MIIPKNTTGQGLDDIFFNHVHHNYNEFLSTLGNTINNIFNDLEIDFQGQAKPFDKVVENTNAERKRWF